MSRDVELSTSESRYLAFFMIDGTLLARANTPELAIKVATAVGMLPNADAIEILDCGREGRKIWLHNRSAGMPIFLHVARKRHKTVYRGDFYASPEWYGSQLPPIPLTEA